MSSDKTQLDERVAQARKKLEATLATRESLERAVAQAQDTLLERQKDLDAVLKDEGGLRQVIGELEKTIKAFDDVVESEDSRE